MRLSFIWLLFAAACSPAATTPDGGLDGGQQDGGPYSGPDYASGTRLRAEVYASADGAKKWHGWYDQTLGVECQYETADDGTLRCIPFESLGDAAFGDSSCTQRVAQSSACGASPPDPKYITD